jgi:hypothetical protein
VLLVGWVLACLVFFALPPAQAHDIFAEYIQHALTCAVGSNHLDVELELTFFEHPSIAERKVMDTDSDGQVSTAERESYLARVAPTLAQQVSLHVDGKELTLTPLYEPELDLPENSTTKLSHHHLRIFLFCATPANLKSGDSIVIEDRLWPSARFLGSVHAEGRDGCKLEADTPFTLVATNQARAVPTATIKCLLPPRKPVPTAAAALPQAPS